MLARIDVKYFKLAVGLERIGKETDVDITARCPVCGDSHRNKRAKRLHLYNKGSVTGVNCFNGDCSVHNKTVYSFLRDFFPALLGQYKRENFGNTVEKLAAGEMDVFENIRKKPEKTTIVPHDLSAFMNPIEDHKEALDYLKKRGFSYVEADYGKWYFGYQNLLIGDRTFAITNSIIIPLYQNSVMYGFYSRNITEKDFSTYMPEQNIGFKVWNWFNVDKSQPVYIYEGIFDALSGGIKNSIALMGAKLPDARLAELENPVFVLDNDKTGLMNGLEYSSNAQIYVQPEKYTEKDMNDLMLNHPNVNVSSLIQENLYSGISAEVRIKSKL